MALLYSENLKILTKYFIMVALILLLFISVFAFLNVFFTDVSGDIVVENVNFTYEKEISLSADFKNNESQIIAFSYNVLFDEKEILSDKMELEKQETKTIDIMLPIETKNSLYDCKKHNLTFFIWVGGQKKIYSKEIIMQGGIFDVEISPDGKKSFSDTIEILIKDEKGEIAKNVDVLLFRDDEKVKTLNTNMDGSVKFSPSSYGIGEYTITVRKHDKISSQFYCDKTIKFPVKGRMEIMHVPEYAKISTPVEIFIKMDDIPVTSGWGGKKVTGFYNLEIFNKDTNESNILSYESKNSVVVLNFTSPGHYTITGSCGDGYWTDSKDIEIVDKRMLNVDIQKSVKVGDLVSGKIFADDVIYIDSLEAKIIYPDGSTTIPVIKDSKFSFTPPVSGKYEISVEDAEHKKNTVNVFALDELFLEISPDGKNLIVGDTVRFRVKDRKNSTLNAEIYVNNEKADTYFKIKNLMNNISVKKEGFITINKEITAKGNSKLNIDKQLLTYGEIQTIYALPEPKTELNIKIINKNNSEKIEKSGNFVEFMPTVGEYFAECSKEGYLTINGTFTVIPAQMNVTIEYNEGVITAKAFSKTTNKPVKDVKFNVVFPGKKNLTLFTDEKGETKFKPDEWGNYVFIAEKENFLTYTTSMDIKSIDLPLAIILAIIFLIIAGFIYKYTEYRKFVKRKAEQKVKEEVEYKEGVEQVEQEKEQIEFESPLSKIYK